MNKKLLFLAGLAPLVAAPALVVASCSSSTSSSLNEEQAKEALKKSFDYLQSKIYFFGEKLPSEVKLTQTDLPALKPSQNLGFATKYFDKAVTDNDEAGTKKIKIQVSKGNLVKEEVFEFKGFLTKQQKDNETKESKLKIEDYINLDPVSPITSSFADAQTKTAVRKSTVVVKDYKDPSKAPKASEIENYIKDFDTKKNQLLSDQATSDKDDEFNLYFKSLVKEKAKTDGLKSENFKFSNISKRVVGTINAPVITADVQLVDNGKESGVVKLELVGLMLDDKYDVNTLINQTLESVGTIYSPFIDDAKSSVKLASEIKSASELENVLLSDWKTIGNDTTVPIEITAEISEIVSANDSEGSLTVKFNFKRTDNSKNQDLGTKEIKLFGFKLA